MTEEQTIATGDSFTFTGLSEPSSITFYVQGAEGMLYVENGKLCFKGDLEKSAQVLMQYICDQMPAFAKRLASGESPV